MILYDNKTMIYLSYGEGSSVGRAPVFDTVGRGFELLHPSHLIK